jgi:zinc D-Ala-D-Ala carboxypeptidase
MAKNNWEFFSHTELACRGTGECAMDADFMDKLVALRKAYDKPMILTSAYRSPEHNANIGGAKNSPHIYGKAVDVLCYGTDAYNLITNAIGLGFTGIGISQKGDILKRFIHIDTMERSDVHIRPTVWSY